MGQCPAKSGLWGYNFITIKIACYTKQHIFATVQPFPFKFRTLVSTSSLYVRMHFEALIIFNGVSAKIVYIARVHVNKNILLQLLKRTLHHQTLRRLKVANLQLKHL